MNPFEKIHRTHFRYTPLSKTIGWREKDVYYVCYLPIVTSTFRPGLQRLIYAHSPLGYWVNTKDMLVNFKDVV